MTAQRIIEITAEVFGLEAKKLIGKRGKREITDARHVAICHVYILYRFVLSPRPFFPMQATVDQFGILSHTTVIHAQNNVDALLLNKDFEFKYNQVAAMMWGELKNETIA